MSELKPCRICKEEPAILRYKNNPVEIICRRCKISVKVDQKYGFFGHMWNKLMDILAIQSKRPAIFYFRHKSITKKNCNRIPPFCWKNNLEIVSESYGENYESSFSYPDSIDRNIRQGLWKQIEKIEPGMVFLVIDHDDICREHEGFLKIEGEIKKRGGEIMTVRKSPYDEENDPISPWVSVKND